MTQSWPEKVIVSSDLLAKAREDFPPARSDDGKPSFADFCDGPLEAAKLVFARRFDEAPCPEPGITSIRQWDTLSKLFGPVFFYAMRVADHIEIVSYEYQADYWEQVGDDPDG